MPIGREPGRHGESPRKKRPRQVSVSSAVSAVAILVVGVMMIVGILVKGRKTKGSCVYEQRTMYCRHKALQSLPTLPQDIVSLQIGERGEKVEHHMTSLQAVNFSGLSELQDIRLVKCQIESIDDATFNELGQLRSLDVSHNKLQVLPPRAFQGLKELSFLNLSSNPLHKLDAHIFSGIKIDHLLLANNPALTELSSETFRGAEISELSLNRCDFPHVDASLFTPLSSSLSILRITHNQRELTIPYKTFTWLKLSRLDLTNSGVKDVGFLAYLHSEELILDDNPLEEVQLQKGAGLKHTRRLSLRNTGLKHIQKKDLAYLSGVEFLDLSQNNLKVFTSAVFMATPQLTTLHLHQNSLELLDGQFEDSALPRLKNLFLHDNRITHLDEHLRGLFHRLEIITLHENPLHCNCQLQWLWQLLKDKTSAIQQPQAVSCLTPQKENITKLSSSHLQCQKPVILNATLDTDRLSVTCTAQGDPAPTLNWITPQGTQSRSPSPASVVTPTSPGHQSQSMSSLPVTRPGNYTCVAENVAGQDTVIINTETMTTDGLKLRLKSKKIDILETKEGFAVTCVLLFILGYIFRNS